MEHIFDDGYDRLYDRLAAQVNFYPKARGERGEDANRLRKIIDLRAEEHSVTLRSDARYLLAVLFLQMIVMPVSISRPSVMPQVWSSIDNDIDKLLDRISHGTLQSQVSGHAMLNRIVSDWALFDTTSFKIWGD